MFIIYEGTDRSGKTSTRKLVEKQRNGKDVVIDRFIGSNIVYGNVFNRYTEDEKISNTNLEIKFSIMFKPVLIFLYAPVEEIIKRMKKDNHEDIDMKILESTLEEYYKYFETAPYEYKIKINTNEYDREKVVELILEYLKYVESM